MKISGVTEIVQNTFGLWITALFDAILVPNPTLTFEEQKEAFFWLIERLLREGKIKFCPPHELWHESYDVWDADIPTIVTYLHVHWPVTAKSKDDLILCDYFYAMPAILWIADDGKISSS